MVRPAFYEIPWSSGFVFENKEPASENFID